MPQFSVQFDINADQAVVTASELNDRGILEILENWIRAQAGKGKDTSEPTEADKVTLTFTWNPENDAIACEHDCLNESLALGIAMAILGKGEPLTHQTR